MNIKFIWPGKTRDKRLASLVDDFVKRIRKYTSIEIVETSVGHGKNKKDTETEKMLAKAPSGAYIVLLSENGEQFTTKELVRWMEKIISSGKRSLVFMVCGEKGCTKLLQEKSDMVLSLTLLTVTHEMARMILAEQIYRVFTVLNNHPYHKW